MKYHCCILLVILLFSLNLQAISKKESIYQDGQPLNDWSESAGWNSGWLASCTGGNGSTIQKKIRKKVANLSWPDFKKFNKGKSSWEQGNYRAAQCSQSEFDEAKNGLYEYVDYLEYLVNLEIGNNTNTQNNANNKNTNIELNFNESDDDEIKLRKLKKFFEENLITEDEYNEKRKAILDNM